MIDCFATIIFLRTFGREARRMRRSQAVGAVAFLSPLVTRKNILDRLRLFVVFTPKLRGRTRSRPECQ
jgi:hypothetical protein